MLIKPIQPPATPQQVKLAELSDEDFNSILRFSRARRHRVPLDESDPDQQAALAAIQRECQRRVDWNRNPHLVGVEEFEVAFYDPYPLANQFAQYQRPGLGIVLKLKGKPAEVAGSGPWSNVFDLFDEMADGVYGNPITEGDIHSHGSTASWMINAANLAKPPLT